MYSYTLPNGLPGGSRTVWSNLPLRPLVTGPLTPFSYHLLAEIAGRAWYQYYDRLGFDPMPRARVLRQHQGRPYLNLTISAQRDAESAAIEPLTLHLDGQPFAICKWEKPGLIAGLKFGLAQNRVESLLKSLATEIDTITQQAKAWYAKVGELRWTQAEVLQIMEEIENVGAPSFLVFLAARHNLDLLYNRLIRLAAGSTDLVAALALIDQALGDEGEEIEWTIQGRLVQLSQAAGADGAVRDWLLAGKYGDWQDVLAHRALLGDLHTFLAQFGHRTLQEGEVCHPRWADDPTALFAILAKLVSGQVALAARRAATPQPLLDASEPNRRKEAQQLVQKVALLRRLQSQALHAFAYILAGARRWALAAARDAMADQRLLAVDDVFFFEPEEMKEMMTGEWNVSSQSEIQATARRRESEYKRWQKAEAAELLIGESEGLSRQLEIPPALIGGLPSLL
ncbi:MAG: hypothetical protein DCC55_34935 [Chloroflexi bacterium]|nr:MAG: hypothetical protein DCC55_34935 [Chloroflexota bacterium]